MQWSKWEIPLHIAKSCGTQMLTVNTEVWTIGAFKSTGEMLQLPRNYIDEIICKFIEDLELRLGNRVDLIKMLLLWILMYCATASKGQAVQDQQAEKPANFLLHRTYDVCKKSLSSVENLCKRAPFTFWGFQYVLYLRYSRRFIHLFCCWTFPPFAFIIWLILQFIISHIS